MNERNVIILCAVLFCQFVLNKAEENKQVFFKVQTDAILPCDVDVPYDNLTYLTYTWTQGSVLFFTAKEDGNNITLTYLTDALKSKYSLSDEYGLKIKDVEMTDTGQYSCTVGVYRDQETIDLSYKLKNITELYVQDVPSKPGRPQYGDLGTRKVVVWWSASTEEHNSPIKNYFVQVRTNQGNWIIGHQVTENIHVKNISTTVENLRPYTTNQLRVVAVNSIGQSLPSDPSAFFLTPEEEPEAPPRSLVATSDNSSVIHITWDPPPADTINGELKGYEILYSRSDVKVTSAITFEVSGEESTKPQKLEIPGVTPYTEYIIEAAAMNNMGKGPSARTAVVTAEGRPSKPYITHASDYKPRSVMIHWVAPKKMNGRLQKYQLQWIHKTSGIVRTKVINGGWRSKMSENITNLEPYTSYEIRVRAVTGGGEGEFSDRYPATTDVAAAGPPTILNVTTVGTDTIFLRWQPPKKEYREIDEYQIEIADQDSFHLRKEIIPTSRLQLMKDGEQHFFEASVTNILTNKKYSIRIAGVTQSLFYAIQFVGNYSDQEYFQLQGINETSTPEPESNFTNIIIADPRAIEAAEKEIMSAGIVAGIVCGILVVLFASLVFIGCRSLTCRKYYQAAYNYLAVPTNSNHFPSTVITIAEPIEERTYPEIKVEDFIQHVKTLHADTDDKFSQEYNDVNKHTRTDLKSEVCNYPENQSKNRYVNITAFDHSRVYLAKLPPHDRVRQSDYINANYVDGYQKSKAYIATQGPMPSTFGDFWRMVWEQRSVVIVMITKLMEKGRRKCDKYWPDEGLEQHGNIAVKHLNTFSRAHYTVRMFSLKDTKAKKQSSERIVYQFHYTEWPDHGVPDFTLPVLKFVQKSAFANPPGAGPIVVHCSAGVGRTGTYILIDTMIEQIKDKGTVNIPQFLLKIRQQRNFLVQTEEQYMLIHDALVEYLLSHDTEVRNGEIHNYIQNLTKIGDDGCSLLQKHHLLITAYNPKEIDKYPSMEEYNVPKNRYEDLVPMTTKRVQLPTKPGVQGSDYINATYLQGYTRTNEFILTQHPLESTIQDFWRMVWDQNSSVIVLLSEENDDFARFWPEEDEPLQIDMGMFKLAFRETEEGSVYTVRYFLLESTQDDYVLMTKMISCSNWPNPDEPFAKAFELIDTVRDIYRQNDIGSVIVVDRFGGVTGCKFCALWSSLDQLQHDKTIDIYHLCKLYHKKRPGIIGTLEDYLFLYSAVEAYCNDQSDKDSAIMSHHLILRSAKRNGTLPRSPSVQNKIPKSPSLQNHYNSNSSNSSKVETNV